MSALGIFDSVRIQTDVTACEHCGLTSRVGRGFCLNCLLQRALSDIEKKETLEAVLDEIDVRDADWRIGNYQILEEIGRGGMGVIYRARQRHSRRIVALKRVLSYHADSRETLARFRREAEAVASLDHPNILPIYEVSEGEDGLPFFSMKFAPGGSLLDAGPALRDEPRRSVVLLAKVARAVQHAHLQGILHRDLKPGNILLDGRGEPLVSDFGLAKWLDANSDLTRTLTIFGTPGYIAPEQARRSAANLMPTADVYSLGAILFDLFTGHPPFLGEHALAVIQQASEKPAPKLRSLIPGFDRDLETICAKCLERDPQARYRSAGDLAEDLERWLEGRHIVARPVSAPVRVWRWSKRNPRLAGSIAACLALGISAGAFQLQNHLAARAAAAAMHSVAVAPLLNLDTAQPDSRLSSEIARALQNELSKRGPARVTSVSDNAIAAASSGSSDEDAKARWQAARTALQGTKRIRDGKLRLSLRLVNAADGKVLYRRIIESEVFGKAADSAAKLTAANIYAILSTPKPTPIQSTENDPGWRDQNARELLIAGKAVMDRRTVVDLDRAIDLFKKVVKAEPRSALASSYLAEAHYARALVTSDAGDAAAANTSAKAAIDLNPTMPEAHKALSCVLFQQGRFRESLEEAFAAYELADSDAGVLTSEVANNLRMLGDPARAAAWYRITKTNRPGTNEFAVADCLADLADDENAAAGYRRVWTLFPELPEGWMGLCRLALLQRDFDTARKISTENWIRYRDFAFSEEMAAQVEFFSRNFPEAEKLYQELASKDPNGGSSFYGAVSYQSALGRLHLAAADEKSGARILEEELRKEFEALRSAPNHPEILYRVAAIEASLGRVEVALEHLRAATKAGWIDYRSLDLDPRFDALRSDRRYQEIFGSIVTRVASLRAEKSPAKVTQK
jgi:tetratricopeptide (TPR) repeat protein/tRNA A-37 threonylcarbamoyl transferase component Bud32